MLRRPVVIAAVGCVLGCVLAAAAGAQDSKFPDHPVRVIVSVPAGGGVDTVTRIVAAKMSAVLGQPMPVENKSGAAGGIAADAVFHADADGYTLLASQPAPITTNPFLYKSLNYDPMQLTPVVIMSHVPNVLLVRPDFPANTVQELIAYAKANPGKLSVGTPGIGSPHHLAVAMLNASAGIDITHVPYKGTAPALNDLLGGQIPLIWATPNVVMQYVEAGKIKPLAVGSLERIALLPNVPTLNESGVPGFDVSVWFGIAGPAKMPRDMIERVSREIAAIDKLPDVKEKTSPLGYDLKFLDSQHLTAKIAADHARYGKVIRDAGITPD
jgi:tripartite-type tricarboxylate transporter receptor subunit TctC